MAAAKPIWPPPLPILVRIWAILLCLSCCRICYHLRATFSPSSNTSYDRRFDEIRTAPLLILDDLGTQSMTPWVREKLYQLFNYRYNAELPTVITTADTLDEMDARIRSR